MQLDNDNGFEFLDHPADLGLRIWGDSLDSLFFQAHRALTSTLFDIEQIDSSTTTSIELESFDRDQLMYDWLSELIFLFDAEGKIFNSVSFERIEIAENKSFLLAKACGEEYSPGKHQIKTYVKAITMHQLSIIEKENGFESTIYLDI